MAFASYGELHTALGREIARPDVIARLGDLIKLAEDSLWRELKGRFMLKLYTDTVGEDVQEANLGALYCQEIVSVELKASDSLEATALFRLPDKDFDMIQINPTKAMPAACAFELDVLTDQKIAFDCQLDQDYTLLLQYWRRWANMAMDATAAASPILAEASELLYGKVLSLVVDERAVAWKQNFSAAKRQWIKQFGCDQLGGRRCYHSMGWY